MSKLNDIRVEIAGLLGGIGIDVVPDVPENINPPICIITKDTPYVTAATPDEQATYHEKYGANLILLFIFGRGSIEQLDNDADDLIESILAVLGDITEVSPLVEIDLPSGIYTGFSMRMRTLTSL